MLDKDLLLDILTDKLNEDNVLKRNRKIMFWYDPTGDYSLLVDELVLDNTEIIKYDNNSFWIRYYIEKVELNKNIIVYLPIDRLSDLDNNLLDLETFNSDLLFSCNITTLRLQKLNLSNDCKDVVDKYKKFFNNKKREMEFRQFDYKKDSNSIDYIVTSILLNLKSVNLDEIFKSIIGYYFDDLKKYNDLFKYGDEKFILGLFNDYFGCNLEDHRQLGELYKSLIFTYFSDNLYNIGDIGRYSKYLLTNKIANVYVFVNSLMRDKNTKKYFEIISKLVEKEFGILELLENIGMDNYKNNDTFESIDKKILEYLVNQLTNNIGEYDKYESYISIRENKYWYDFYVHEYNFLKFCILFFKSFSDVKKLIKTSSVFEFINNYVSEIYELDTLYRKIYYYFDNIQDNDLYVDLKNRIENLYVNDFISELSINWGNLLEDNSLYSNNNFIIQNQFYDKFIEPYNDKKDRIIVIISDAFRYECASELVEQLQVFASKVEISYMLGVVPSYTKLAMAALLPHNKLSKDSLNDDVLVDNYRSSSIKERELILQNKNSDSIAIKYNDLYEMTKMDWKKKFSGKKIVYIYHNVIDNVGEYDENKVFEACEIAIFELLKLIKDLHTTFSGVNVYTTSDHGFFYKRGKIQNYEKTKNDNDLFKSRYSYSEEKLNSEGILSISLDYIFGKKSGYVNIPKGNIVYTKKGDTSTYIHGGILPQEIIVPVINFKSNRISEESKKVGITYSGLSFDITNSVTYLEFLQDSNVDENNRICRYLLYFEDEFGNKISNECIIIANYKNKDVKDRFFREKFVFKNIEYNKNNNYYLVFIDDDTGKQLQKIKFSIDILNIDNFN